MILPRTIAVARPSGTVWSANICLLIAEQQNAGIRYFDLRVGYHVTNDGDGSDATNNGPVVMFHRTF